MSVSKNLLLLLVGLTASSLVVAQGAADDDNQGIPGRLDLMSSEERVAAGLAFHTHMSEPVEPFRVLGNIYFVGTSNIGSYLISSPEGHFLIDTGVAGMAPKIRDSVEALGFDMRDIRVLLSSHAHFDHVQGHAIVQRMSGAQVMAIAGDADALEAGHDLSPLAFEGWEPVNVDRRLQDGEEVTLGNVTLTPTWAPGHTQGCTTWSLDTTDSGESVNVAIFGCNGPNEGVQLVNNPRFPELVEQSLQGFDNLARLQPDIYLTGHPQQPFEGIEHQMRVQMRPHPLLRQQPWAEFIAQRRSEFEARVAAERARLANL
ncbi:MAG: subclass B3 metallo-beta-lactamase [Pseudohongiella sp.]|uniref:subclass B3 metallo-beta-lactamase n=1 Tax=Pseudohongiella sp. TaxID=1979412 RepID=UPI0034A0643E